MKKRAILLCLFTLILLLLSGCWNRRELNELAIVMAFGLDKEGDQFVLTAQVVVPSEVATKASGGSRIPVIMYKEKGETIFEALRKMTLKSPRRLYAAHIYMLVIGEELAREGIAEALDFMSRDHEFRTDFYVAVAKDQKAEEILKITTVLEKIPALQMYKSLKTSADTWAPSTYIPFDELISDVLSKGKQAVLTGIEREGSLKAGETQQNAQMIDPDTQFAFSTLAVFKKDRLVGWLNENESKGYNYIHNTVKNTVGHIPCPKRGKLTLELLRSKTKVKGKVVNGEPKIEIHVRAEESIGDVECSIDLTKSESITQLEKIAEETLKELIVDSIHKAQKKYKVDIFGFGEEIHRSNPTYWAKVKDHWDRKFEDLEVTVHTEVKIRRIGTSKNSVIQQIKE